MTESKMSEWNERLILGIDPGYGRMGYAVVAAAGNDLRLIVCDAIMTPTGQAYPLRLQLIYEELSVIIRCCCNSHLPCPYAALRNNGSAHIDRTLNSGNHVIWWYKDGFSPKSRPFLRFGKLNLRSAKGNTHGSPAMSRLSEECVREYDKPT